MSTELLSADEKTIISKRSFHLAVNVSITAFTTKENKLKVIKIVERENNLIIEPKMPFIKPKRIATQR